MRYAVWIYYIFSNSQEYQPALVFQYYEKIFRIENIKSWYIVTFPLSSLKILGFFSYQGFPSGTLATHRTVGEGKGPSLFHSTTSTHSRTFIHLQLCMWDDYHIFLIPPLAFNRLLLDEIHHLIELPIDWLMMWC